MTAAPRLALSLCLLGAAACSASPGTNDAAVRDSSGADAATTDGGATSDAVLGTFQVHLVPPTDAGAGYTSIVGRVQDGPTPEQVIWELALADGACRLVTPRVPFCSTPCGGSAACVADDTCQAYPSPQSVGAVRVTGLRTTAGETSFDLTAVANTYQLAGTTLPFPAFSEGDAIAVATAGSTWSGPFTLAARGIAPLTLAESTVRVATGEAVALRWNAPTQTGLRVRVSLDISHHGGTRGKIECAADDTGALTIAAPLITRLVALGVAGFPTIIVSRESVGEAALRAGRVQLSVASTVEVPVEIPNVRSCTENSECPSGTCRPDLRCE